MQIDFKKEIKALNGEAYKENMASVVANHLFNAKSDDPLKTHDWALKLHNDGVIEVDSSDINKLTEAIKKFEIPDGVLGQILKELFSQRG